MAHVPHLFIAPPWEADVLRLDTGTVHHLGRVLRRSDGSPVSYTDGAGTLGTGTLRDGAVVRGSESVTSPLPDVRVAAAVPHAAERTRFLVEKCVELGVRRVVWITTEHGRGRPPKADKAHAWAVAALQQSRGTYATDVAGPLDLADLVAGGGVIVAARGGRRAKDIEWPEPVTIVIGPEGGLTPEEVAGLPQLSLGDRVLRTETAAMVAASVALETLRAG